MDAGEGVTRLTYNAFGYPKKIISPLGGVRTICYNDFNLPISSQDENNIVTTYRYNEAGLIDQVSQTHEGTTLSYPLGYPDGWNALAYCNNGVTDAVDLWGGLKVYIWEYSGSLHYWGHASMELENGEYISRWPMGNTSTEQYRFYVWGFTYFYFAVSIYNRTMIDDLRDENSCPDYVLQVDGLDEDKIQEWWNSAKYEVYGTIENNCAETVAKGLKAGGAETPWWDFTSSWNIVWTPNNVKDYAEAIEIQYFLKYMEMQYE